MHFECVYKIFDKIIKWFMSTSSFSLIWWISREKSKREISSNTTCINAMQTFGFYAVILFPLSLFLLLSSITFVLSNGIICISTEEVWEGKESPRRNSVRFWRYQSHRIYGNIHPLSKLQNIKTRNYDSFVVALKNSLKISFCLY